MEIYHLIVKERLAEGREGVDENEITTKQNVLVYTQIQ
jgi:hypothetical protein